MHLGIFAGVRVHWLFNISRKFEKKVQKHTEGNQVEPLMLYAHKIMVHQWKPGVVYIINTLFLLYREGGRATFLSLMN